MLHYLYGGAVEFKIDTGADISVISPDTYRMLPNAPRLNPSVARIVSQCNGGYFSETSLRPRIPPARPRDPVIHIKPQAPKARGCCLIRIQVLVSSQKQGAAPSHGLMVSAEILLHWRSRH